MPSPHHVVIEVFVVLTIINTFLGVGQMIYQSEHPSESIRSPFTSFPLASEFPELNATNVTQNMITPTNSSGGVIEWVVDAIADFTATIDVILEFTQFFTGGFIAELLTSFGFPEEFRVIIVVPMSIYTMYMIFVMITNRLGN